MAEPRSTGLVPDGDRQQTRGEGRERPVGSPVAPGAVTPGRARD